MDTIIVLIIIIILVLAVFLFLFLREDTAKLQQKFNNWKKQDLDKPKSKIDTTVFKQWLSIINFENTDLRSLKDELHKAIIGMEEFINSTIVNILCGWHVLVEWVPGLAKTKTISIFSQAMGMDFKRIQFTPDMLPSDIVWVDIFNSKTKEFETRLWPIVANIILADEINRATPKVQSALLESMQEKQVTISGKTYPLPDPFFVLATQNPLEQEWTYPLPEAQIDRFLFKVLVDYPNLAEEKEVLDYIENEENIKIKKVISHTKFQKIKKELEVVNIWDEIKDYITRLIAKTREKNPNILYGSSPRWSIGLMIASKALAFIEWRDYVKHEDVQRVAMSVLRHRIVLTYDAKIQWLTEDKVLLDLLWDVKLI